MATTASPPPSPPAGEIGFVGRAKERLSLTEALERARSGEGSCWLLEGPAGIGKTRILRWFDITARAGGSRVFWGRCMRETLAPFFPFEQIFRNFTGRGAAAAAAAEGPAAPARAELPSMLLVEEDRPKRVMEVVAGRPGDPAPLLLTREKPEVLRARFTTLPAAATILWLSRVEAPNVVSPLQMDALGERLAAFLRASPGRVASIAGLEYLASQNSFLPVLRLIQFLRDAAEASGGHVVISLAPGAFDARELALLEAEGEVERAPTVPSPSPDTSSGSNAAPTQRLLDYLTALERAVTKDPLVLVMDDLQWADPMSVRAFEFLARNLRTLPVVLVAAARDDELALRQDEGETTLVEVLDTLSREGSLRVVHVDGLSPEESAELSRESLGAPPPGPEQEAGILRLVGRMGGNPYYVLETLHQMQELGQLRRDRGRWTLDLPPGGGGAGAEGGGELALPASVRRLVQRRLDRLPKADRALLEAGAVLGPQFEIVALAAATSTPESDLQQRAQRLEQLKLLRREPDPPKTYAFADSLLWDVTLGSLPPERAQALAQASAAWWSTHRPDDVETVARLYHLASSVEAAPWIRLAIQRALESRSGAVVERYVRWLRDSTPDDPEAREAEAREEIRWARKLDEIGYLSTAVRILRQMLARPQVDLVRWEAKATIAYAVTYSDPGLAKQLLEELDVEVPKDPSKCPEDLHARILIMHGRHAEVAGRWQEALDYAHQAFASPGAKADPWVAVSGHSICAWALKELNRMDEARHELDEGINLARDSPLPGRLGTLLNTRGSILEALGELEEAQHAFEEAIEVSRGGGMVSNVIVFLANLGEDRILLGDPHGARAPIEEAQQLAQKFHLNRPALIAKHQRGMLWEAEGDPATSRKVLEEVSEEYVRIGFLEDLGAVHLHLAEALRDLGESSLALQELASVEAGKWGSLEARLHPQIDRVRGSVHLKDGNLAESRAAFERARDEAKTIGNRYEEAGALAGLAVVADRAVEPAAAKELGDLATEMYRACGVTHAPPLYLPTPPRTTP